MVSLCAQGACSYSCPLPGAWFRVFRDTGNEPSNTQSVVTVVAEQDSIQAVNCVARPAMLHWAHVHVCTLWGGQIPLQTLRFEPTLSSVGRSRACHVAHFFHSTYLNDSHVLVGHESTWPGCWVREYLVLPDCVDMNGSICTPPKTPTAECCRCGVWRGERVALLNNPGAAKS